MSPRTGRPTTNPKTEEIKVRATKEDKEQIGRASCRERVCCAV